ncbi:hypothetical protein IEQ34_020666 [Dendrobium chrysotoxum]|uniref:DUF4408 domain-containing protein n=1 Tax=Dendrobium chrysotoxum TaxID=161865 RepID=A0AAV7G2Z7_DENCH|nr:hypothetical protein IEQ34_020666 [Dendrobium chrysotoxum]
MESDKQTAGRRFHLQQFRRLFSYIGATVALLLFSYSSFYIPIPPSNPGDLFRRAAAILVSPWFVFLVGNIIILLLIFAKSGQLSTSSEFISSEFNSCEVPYPSPPHLGPIEEVEYEEKKVCVEISSYRRSKSEKLERVREEPELRRSETAVVSRGRKGEVAHDGGDSEGEEDAEHFRRTIEEFIAKHQRRFQREESLAVVSFSDGITEPFTM